MAQHQKVIGLPQLSSNRFFCSGCNEGKQSRKRKPPVEHRIRATADESSTWIARSPDLAGNCTRTTEPLALVHSDLCGPLSIPSLSGTRYVLTMTDDFSRFTWLYFLKKKDETLSKFKQFRAMIELQSNFKIKAIRSDKGEEYTTKAFQAYCDEFGILRQYTQSHTPHQNGVAERKNRTLLEKARCMAFESKIPAYLWSEAVATANYLVNRTPTQGNAGMTPYEKLTGNQPSLKHLRIFGCRTFVLNTDPSRKK